MNKDDRMVLLEGPVINLSYSFTVSELLSVQFNTAVDSIG